MFVQIVRVPSGSRCRSFDKDKVMIVTDESVLQETMLIQRAVKGDLDAFNQLVLKYQHMAYRRAYNLLGEHQCAEDATQESFIRVFQNLRQFRGTSFRAWLLKIVTNTCYDFFRRSKRHAIMDLIPRGDSSNEIEFQDWLADSNTSVQDSVEQNELSRALYRILDELPHRYRDILTLVDIHELDYTEAAEVLGIPVGTVKSRLARARYQMRERISQSIEISHNSQRTTHTNYSRV